MTSPVTPNPAGRPATEGNDADQRREGVGRARLPSAVRSDLYRAGLRRGGRHALGAVVVSGPRQGAARPCDGEPRMHCCVFWRFPVSGPQLDIDSIEARAEAYGVVPGPVAAALCAEIRHLRQAPAAVERLCKSFDPTSGSGRARAFVGDIRAALGAVVTPTPQETCEHGYSQRHGPNYAGNELDIVSYYDCPGPVTSTPEAATKAHHCPTCEGRGRIDADQHSCPTCFGRGIVIAPSGLQRATEQQQ